MESSFKKGYDRNVMPDGSIELHYKSKRFSPSQSVGVTLLAVFLLMPASCAVTLPVAAMFNSGRDTLMEASKGLWVTLAIIVYAVSMYFLANAKGKLVIKRGEGLLFNGKQLPFADVQNIGTIDHPKATNKGGAAYVYAASHGSQIRVTNYIPLTLAATFVEEIKAGSGSPLEMRTDAYVRHGSVLTDHLGPINATMVVATGTLLPIMDFVRPHFPHIGIVAGVIVLFFGALLAMKLLKVPADRVIPTSLVFCAGACALAFSVGAVASSRHAEGFIAAKSDDARAIQSNLLNLEKQTASIGSTLDGIQAGRSSDPRVELKNIGVEWSESAFHAASRRGDLRVVELFLRGGMPIHDIHSSRGASLALYIVNGDHPRAQEQFALMKKYGVDLDDRKTIQSRPDPATPPNLYFHALETGKTEAAQALAGLGVRTAGYAEWKANKPVVPHVVLPGIL